MHVYLQKSINNNSILVITIKPGYSKRSVLKYLGKRLQLGYIDIHMATVCATLTTGFQTKYLYISQVNLIYGGTCPTRYDI